jgi:hypothetical protein
MHELTAIVISGTRFAHPLILAALGKEHTNEENDYTNECSFHLFSPDVFFPCTFYYTEIFIYLNGLKKYFKIIMNSEMLPIAKSPESPVGVIPHLAISECGGHTSSCHIRM